VGISYGVRAPDLVLGFLLLRDIVFVLVLIAKADGSELKILLVNLQYIECAYVCYRGHIVNCRGLKTRFPCTVAHASTGIFLVQCAGRPGASVRGIVKLVTDPGVRCCANGLMQRITEELELELGLRAPIPAVMAGYHSEAEVVKIACGVEKPHVAGKKDTQPWNETETAAQRDVDCKAHAGRHEEKEGR
jgi:hypothetical protein